MKVLIGYDGSESADAALHDLRRAGLPQAGEAVVLSVADVWPRLCRFEGERISSEGSMFAFAEAVMGRELEHAREMANNAVQRVLADLPKWKVTSDAAVPDWTVTSEARADAPHWAIIKKAEEWKADLIVLGSHGRSAFDRVLLGSISQSVLIHAKCSVRIGRSSPQPPGKPVKLLIGVDGSPSAGAAASVAAGRKWPKGSEARVLIALDSATVTAAPVEPDLVLVTNPTEQSAVDWLTSYASQTADQLRAAGLNATAVAKKGGARKLLVEEAQAWGADCIFVGAKGLSRLERFLVGSVSSAVAARARCSVEVVRVTN